MMRMHDATQTLERYVHIHVAVNVYVDALRCSYFVVKSVDPLGSMYHLVLLRISTI